MAKKRLLFYLLFIFASIRCDAIDMALRTNFSDQSIGYVDVTLDFGQMVYKDSIRVSLDSSQQRLLRWQIEDESVEEYIVPLKIHKNVYKTNFSIQFFLERNRFVHDDPSLYISCFVIDHDEYVTPVLNKIILSHTGVPKIERIQEDHKRRSKIALLVKKISGVNKHDRLIGFFNTKSLLLIFLLVLFIVFIIVDILLVTDLVILFGLGLWFAYVRRSFPSIIIEVSSALLMVSTSIWYMKSRTGFSRFLRRVRLAIGLACASSVLPLLIKAWLLWWRGG